MIPDVYLLLCFCINNKINENVIESRSDSHFLRTKSQLPTVGTICVESWQEGCVQKSPSTWPLKSFTVWAEYPISSQHLRVITNRKPLRPPVQPGRQDKTYRERKWVAKWLVSEFRVQYCGSRQQMELASRVAISALLSLDLANFEDKFTRKALKSAELY